jgi:hypothetical protein
MIPPQLKLMFDSMVLPTLRELPDDDLRELVEFLMRQVNAEFTRRAAMADDVR